MKKELQIDVMPRIYDSIDDGNSYMKCNVYIDGRCVQMFISTFDYHLLRRDGVFIRDGKQVDSAGVVNTTKMWVEIE